MLASVVVSDGAIVVDLVFVANLTNRLPQHAGLRHPFMAVMIFIGIIGGLAYALHSSIQSDMRQAGSSRLD